MLEDKRWVQSLKARGTAENAHRWKTTDTILLTVVLEGPENYLFPPGSEFQSHAAAVTFPQIARVWGTRVSVIKHKVNDTSPRARQENLLSSWTERPCGDG